MKRYLITFILRNEMFERCATIFETRNKRTAIQALTRQYGLGITIITIEREA